MGLVSCLGSRYRGLEMGASKENDKAELRAAQSVDSQSDVTGALAPAACSARSYGQSPFASLKELVDYFVAVCEHSEAVVINAIKSYIVSGWTKYHGAFSIAQKQNQRILETLEFLRALGPNRQPYTELRLKSL